MPGETVENQDGETVQVRKKVSAEEMSKLPEIMQGWEVKDNIDESRVTYGNISAKIEEKEIYVHSHEDGEEHKDGDETAQSVKQTVREATEIDIGYKDVFDIYDKISNADGFTDKFVVSKGTYTYTSINEDGDTVVSSSDQVRITSRDKESDGFEVIFVSAAIDDEGRCVSININTAGVTDDKKAQEQIYYVLKTMFGADVAEVMVYNYYDTVIYGNDEDPYDILRMSTTVKSSGENTEVGITRSEYAYNTDHRVAFNLGVFGLYSNIVYTGKNEGTTEVGSVGMSDVLGGEIKDGDIETAYDKYLKLDGKTYDSVEIVHESNGALTDTDGKSRESSEVYFARKDGEELDLQQDLYIVKIKDTKTEKLESFFMVMNGVTEVDTTGLTDEEASKKIGETLVKQLEYFAGKYDMDEKMKEDIVNSFADGRQDWYEETEGSMLVKADELDMDGIKCTRKFMFGLRKAESGERYGVFRVLYNMNY